MEYARPLGVGLPAWIYHDDTAARDSTVGSIHRRAGNHDNWTTAPSRDRGPDRGLERGLVRGQSHAIRRLLSAATIAVRLIERLAHARRNLGRG